jgi:hypothetical protein
VDQASCRTAERNSVKVCYVFSDNKDTVMATFNVLSKASMKMPCGMLRLVASRKLTDVSEVRQ